MTILYCILCFFLEIIHSVLANWVNVSIISRKPQRAVKYSLATGIAGWSILFIIGKLSDWNIAIMVSTVIGDSIGDYIVASRKIKPKNKNKAKYDINGTIKRTYRKKFPVSTA